MREAPSEQDIPMTAAGRRLMPTVKYLIAVGSGKGGVGKSTVSVYLALALARSGARVGLLDMDVYGPSIPTMLGLTTPPTVNERRRIVPATYQQVQVVSMGFFIKPEDAVVWRGPMLHKTVEQFLGGVEWGELDYLVIDLPPGTGDVQLSLCQLIPLTGAIIVSTPQDVALHVAQRAIAMFRKLRTPVLGLIENMSEYQCPQCGHQEAIFGTEGVRRMAEQQHLPLLGRIPLLTAIRAASDAGAPVLATDPSSPAAQPFIAVAEQVAAQVSVRATEGQQAAQVNIAGQDLAVTWRDGHASMYPGRTLRLQCPCAGCVDEVTGTVRVAATTIPQDVHPVAVREVGQYAINIRWSDGHATGIYAFERLRALCPCEACRATVTGDQ